MIQLHTINNVQILQFILFFYLIFQDKHKEQNNTQKNPTRKIQTAPRTYFERPFLVM